MTIAKTFDANAKAYMNDRTRLTEEQLTDLETSAKFDMANIETPGTSAFARCETVLILIEFYRWIKTPYNVSSTQLDGRK